MRSRSYALGVRQKPRRSWKKTFWVIATLLMLAGVSAVIVPKTQAYDTARQIVHAALGSEGGATKMQLEETEQAVDVTAIPDAQVPTVQIVAPSVRQALSGDAVVQVQANDNIKVAKVEFYVDGSLVGTDETQPYEYNWATSGETNARHVVMAKAYDAAMNVASAQLSYTTLNKQKDTTAPTVTVTSPANGSLVKGIVSMRANATDPSAIAKVEFYVGTTLVGTDDTRPYSFDWDASKSSGVEKITARAYDVTGNVNTSSITTVLIDAGQADTIKPEVKLEVSDGTSQVKDTVTVQATATDDAGIAKIEFYRDNTLLFTDTRAPYSYPWDTLSVENATYKITAKAYDTSGNVQTSRTLLLTVANSADRKPAVSFTAPNVDSQSQTSTVALYGDCTDKLVGKSALAPATLTDLQVIVGFEFASVCSRSGKSATVSVDLGREVTNRSALKVIKVQHDGTLMDITATATIDTRKTNNTSHTFVTYSVIDGGLNDQDGLVNATLADPVFIGEEIKLKPIETKIEPVKPVVQPIAPKAVQPDSVRLIDALGVRSYIPYGVGVVLLGTMLFLFRPRGGYKLTR
ncbi:MAG: hypothetical protein QG629_332 [Patescibacteria group bacterium]|nr:hypothetical protein [Candidatus Saccharibacteria bacterium]MDQ5963250.1 hypothetical protein [Patescibacteria group bacterium]